MHLVKLGKLEHLNRICHNLDFRPLFGACCSSICREISRTGYLFAKREAGGKSRTHPGMTDNGLERVVRFEIVDQLMRGCPAF